MTSQSISNKLAVIDVGSNTVRLLVIEALDAENYKIIDQAQEITRLGQGLSEGKPFLPQAQERTVKVLQKFCQRARDLNAQKIWALGTSAMRRASNAAKFISHVQETCGLDLEVVSGQDEARITLQGVETAIQLKDKRYLMIDIGGGSTEFILSDGHSKIEKLCSIELGAVSLTEKFIPHDPPHQDEFDKMINYLHQQLSPVLKEFSPVTKVVGTAGTITTLAAIAQQMKTYEPSKINNFILRESQIIALLDNFKNQPLASRQQITGLEAKRADIIIAGTTILLVSMKELKINKILVSDAGFREGIMVELLKILGGTA